MTEESQGIIIHAIDYKENSKILYLLTKDGKESLLVNNAKKLNAGRLYASQVLSLVSYSKSTADLARATSLELIDDFNEIKGDIKRFAVASYALELLYKDINADFNSDVLYKMVLTFFNELKKRENLKPLYLEFKIKMLYFLGIQPNFKACSCGAKTNLIGLNINTGMMECKIHQSSGNIGSDATKILRLFYLDKTFELEVSNKEAIDYLLDIVNKYYLKHSGVKIKAEKLIADLSNFT